MEANQLDQLCINTIRMLSIDAVEKAKSGHPGLPLEGAAIAYTLWTRFLRYNPKDPDWPNRDRFVLSAGHGSMLLYSMLYLTGYDLSLDEIKNFRQWGSRTPGHPEYGLAPGVETTTGPLGQGFGNGVGMAIAERYLGSLFDQTDETPLLDYHIYAYCSDGDMMEGVSHEAASLAGHLALEKLIYIYADNRITIEGSTELAFTEDVGKRFEAYGWFVQHVDGNDMEGFARCVENAKAQRERPSLIVARTHLGFGSPKQDTKEAHGEPLGAEAVRQTKEHFGWPLEPDFLVPDEVLEHMCQAIPRGEAMEREWQEHFERYAVAHPDLAEQWRMLLEGALPPGWDEGLPSYDPSAGKVATRTASGETLSVIAPKIPGLIGGSADLSPSTFTTVKGLGDFEDRTLGRTLHFGVREHAMGAALNGMALSKLIPFGGTFLIFSDYMRPPMRLAALMGLRVVYVFTHDSIGLGEDGPTHQSIGQLVGLRAIPNMWVIRPADANETVLSWQVAIEHNAGPVSLVLTRQKLPVIDRSRYAAAEGLRRGAYVLADADGGRPEILLLATGSEVHPALEGYERLREKGIRARVVNMACWELFEQQSRDYQDEVLPPEVTARLAIEAASPLGWWKWVGLHGDVIGMERFGASAPGDVNMEKFGFTAENVVQHALRLLQQPARVKA